MLGRLTPTPSMAVALTALVIAIGGVATAATGGLVSDTGQVTVCVANDDIVKQLSQVISGITTAVSPKGAMRVVDPGQACADGETQLTLDHHVDAAAAEPTADAGLPKAYAAQSAAVKHMDRKLDTLAGQTLPAGNYLVEGAATVRGTNVATGETVSCWFVDATGQVIASSLGMATLLPDQGSTEEVTLPLSALLTDLPAGKLSIACKDSAAASAAAAAAGGSAGVGAAAKKRATQYYGQAQYTAQKANSSQPSRDLHGCPANSFCVWPGKDFSGQMRSTQVDYGARGTCYNVDTRDGNRSIVNNTQNRIATFETTGIEDCIDGSAYSQGPWGPNKRRYAGIDTLAPRESVANSRPGNAQGIYAVGLYDN